MPSPSPRVGKLVTLLLLTVIVSAGATFGVTALLINIFEHKQEAKNPFYRVVELDDNTVDPAVWGKNFPMQYDGYKKTVDMTRTRHGGSEAMPRTPTGADPRTLVSQSKIEEDPRLKTMWAGYAFAIDFREERGHAYMLEDQELTRRQEKPQPGACLHCHASAYVPYKILGDGDVTKGFEKMNPLPYAEAHAKMQEAMKSTGDDTLHPVACIDCHNPDTMQLRVTRPGFMEGIRKVKGAEYDVNRDATRQEMRSFVCAQCHVEYHFKGDEKRLTYPWDKGLKADEILAHYDEIGFKDWTHAETGAPALKAQHPEFEMWSQGIHSRAGVACADCHMPYTRSGALKISDHHIRSPLLNVNNACQTCHKASESELLARVETIQGRHTEMRDRAMDALVELIAEIKEHKTAGVDEAALKDALDFQRKAGFLLDFAEAENSTGFHADQEGARILGLSLDYSRKGWISLKGARKSVAEKTAAPTAE